jgi:hypothetical protein
VLRGWTEEIAVPRHFFAQPQANRWVGDWIGRHFRELGYSVTAQGPYRNIVALRPNQPRGDVTLICAHYDSVATTFGADDNASGVAVMLACAAALVPLDVPVGFVAFNGEEDGLTGSADFISHALAALALYPRMTHVLEMVGFASREPGSQRVPEHLPLTAPPNGDFIGLLTKGRSNYVADLATRLRSSVTPELGLLTLKAPLGLERFVPDLLRSDHAPFWRAGLPAALWTDTGDFRNPNYHQPSDTPATLDYGFMRSLVRLLVAVTSSRSHHRPGR